MSLVVRRQVWWASSMTNSSRKIASPFGRLLWYRHFYPLAMMLGHRFGIRLDPDDLEQACCGMPRLPCSDAPDWDDDHWVEWYRAVLVESGALPLDESLHEDRRTTSVWREDLEELRGPIWLGVELHVFFLHLQETVEMLRRLHTERTQLAPEVARSKMFSAVERVRPIDRTAALVAGRSNYVLST